MAADGEAFDRADPQLLDRVDFRRDLGTREAAIELVDQAELGQTYVVARLNPRTKVRKGDPIELVVDTSRLHFFDPDDGSGIYAIHEYHVGYYATIPILNGQVALGNFGDNGYAWVVNGQGYTVSVGQSNKAYNNGGGANLPKWLDSNGPFGAQLIAAGPANTGPWLCILISGGHQDDC